MNDQTGELGAIEFGGESQPWRLRDRVTEADSQEMITATNAAHLRPRAHRAARRRHYNAETAAAGA